MERILSDEERIRRAEIIAARRQNRIPVNNINNNNERKISKLGKYSIQILSSIIIFGILYFLSQHNIYIVGEIKNQISRDTDFKKIYSYVETNLNKIKEDKMNKQKENDNQKESDEQNGNENDNKNIDDKKEKNVDENGNVKNEQVSEIKENQVDKGIGGGDEGIEVSENVDDVTYIKKNYNFIKPVNAVITSPYGEREETDIISKNHKGIDLGCNTGTEIKAAVDGIVEESSNYGDYGKHVKIVNGELTTLYAHCSELLVKKGDEIKQGQIIAKVGSTGKATGPHLHFEIRRNNIAIDPQKIMSFE